MTERFADVFLRALRLGRQIRAQFAGEQAPAFLRQYYSASYPRKPGSAFPFQYVSDGPLAKPLAEITNMTNNFPRFAELLVMKSTSGEEWI